MANPYVGEIRMGGWNFAPSGWAFCNGQLLSISENTTLFQLIGTIYGGDGQNTFALPNLMGRIPLHQGTSSQGAFIQGQMAGTETVTLTTQQIPSHNHQVQASTSANSASPAGMILGQGGQAFYSSDPPDVAMNAGMIAANAGGQPHDNMVPFLGVTFVISLFGIFPSRN